MGAAIRGPFRAKFERRGKAAFEAYERAIGFGPSIAWKDLPLHRRNAWIEAACAAIGDVEVARADALDAQAEQIATLELQLAEMKGISSSKQEMIEHWIGSLKQALAERDARQADLASAKARCERLERIETAARAVSEAVAGYVIIHENVREAHDRLRAALADETSADRSEEMER